MLPIRFLLPILFAVIVIVVIGVWKLPREETISEPAPTEEVVVSLSPDPVVAPPVTQDVISTPPKNDPVKPAPKPVVTPAPKPKPTPPPPVPTSGPQPVPTLEPVAPASYSSELLSLINNYRVQQGLGSLAASSSLNGLAKAHSDYMALQGSVSHDGFNERFAQANRSSCVENVGWNYATASAQLNGWINSPGHNTNLLNPNITLAGIAKSGTYVTFFACQ